MPGKVADFEPEAVVVAQLPGSLPMGGVVPNTPIFSFSHAPDWLEADSTFEPSKVSREDIDCDGALIFLLRNVVTPEEAKLLIKASEFFGFREEAPGISTPPGMRMNKSVHWIAPEPFLEVLFNRISHLLPKTIEGRPLTNQLSHRLNIYKYDRGDVFNRHIDGDWPGYGLSDDGRSMIQWPGVHSCLSMLLYLNGIEDGVEGGATRLFGRSGTVVDISPKAGDALFFRHGFSPESVVHSGQKVAGKVPKYLARINVLYQSTR
jgi:hypothetical protein